MHWRSRSLPLLLLACTTLIPATAAQLAPSAICPPLSGEEIVNRLVAMNSVRAEALGAYQSTRLYRVDYRGFPGSRSAKMVVGMEFKPPNTKVFTVQSQSGSKLLIDRVFKKLLESETEAMEPVNQQRTALNQENYKFRLLGCEHGVRGLMFILEVEPKTRSKFLYRGRIWVDSEDFAVVRISAELARNPSFWIRKTKIEQVYGKVGPYWLPESNSSRTTVRLGGSAEFTIQYKDYEMTPAVMAANARRARPQPEAASRAGSRPAVRLSSAAPD